MAGGEVALVHDYFVQDGGAEQVALELARLLPDATVYTSFFDVQTFGARLDQRRVRTWPLDGAVPRKHFRAMLPLYPAWFSVLDLRGYKLVVSSSSAFAKAVRTSRRGRHVAYIHSPMRFAWQFSGYSEGSSLPAPARFAGRVLAGPLRYWDRRTAARPDVLVANSHAVRERIRRFWDRPAQVIHPPVDIAEFPLSARDDGFLLVAARLLRHRRIDLAVEAATALGRPLVICGDGPERRALERNAGPRVRFEGHVPRARLVELVRTCRAYLVPGEEDFGIAPVEAMAAGKPVVALARGGAAESVTDGVSGALYATLSADALAAAIQRLDAMELDPVAIRASAERFDRRVFRAAWRALFNRLEVDPALYAAAD